MFSAEIEQLAWALGSVSHSEFLSLSASAKLLIQTTYIIHDRYVTARLFQEQFDNLSSAMFTGTHQSGGSLVVLHINVSATLKQCPHHLQTPMANS